ncbi:MAG: TolC family protein [Chitinophagaceae bacterium]|nr:TolC family protein [Chitinophagaceae bacterium]
MFRMLRLSVSLLFLTAAGRAYAQTADTLYLKFPEAEKLFLQNNLSLLSARYNIDINKAYKQQAAYWNNPVLSTDQNIYDGKFFRHRTVDGQQYGQVYIALQQLILTAGKRNKLIKLADDNVLTAGQQFDELLRNLRFVLATGFNSLDQLWQTNKVYNNEIEAMQKMVSGMDEQLKVGNISQKDNVRVKSLLYSLQSDQADLLRQLADVQKELKVMLNTSDSTFIVPQASPLPPADGLILQTLIDSAKSNRPDFNLARTNLVAQQHNLLYQKALVTPDVTVGAEYDRASSYIPNYYGLSISLPLPVFNRNKGNITAAKYGIKQAETGVQQVQYQVEQDIAAAYSKWLIASNMNNASTGELGNQYDQLMQNMITSYKQRQVSLIEFIDFFDAYKDSGIKQLQQKANLRNAAAELNYTTGTTIINLQ